MNSPNAHVFTQIIVAAAIITPIVVGWMMVANGRKAQRREVTMVQEYATREEMKAATDRIVKVENSIEVLRREMREDNARILKAGEERAEKLHRRITRVLIGVTRVQGRLDIPADANEDEEAT